MEHYAADMRSEAIDLFYEALELQKNGDYHGAIRVYRRSIELFPTAQAYSFMGWALSYLGDLNKAIQCCLKSIEIDPEFGNAYNDIGAYLIDLGRHAEALTWLRKATRARKYDCVHYAWYNLGRVYEQMLDFMRAKDAYARSLEQSRRYKLAETALLRVVAATN